MTNPARQSTELTAHAAFRLYEAAYETDALVQGAWHTERDGRQLACALGTLGPKISSPSDCPATVMPRWLAEMVVGFFDKQKFEDAKVWGLEFYKALDRIGGNVPFSVIHDWHASTVCQLGIDAATKRGRDTAPHVALQCMHKRALAGEKVSVDEWKPVLKAANAYADADAYANAYADAYAYAWKILADGMVAALNRVEVQS